MQCVEKFRKPFGESVAALVEVFDSAQTLNEEATLAGKTLNEVKRGEITS